MLLKDKVALVTGSSRGIGAATAKLLAENGARVVVNYCRDREQGEKVLADIKAAKGEAILVQADVTDPAQCQVLVGAAEKAFGPVDILVNNANMSFPIVPFVNYQWEDLASIHKEGCSVAGGG